MSGSSRIAFRIEREVVLDPLWYDEHWHRELLADGLSEEAALRHMVEVAVREDPISVMWESFGPGQELASEFGRSITGLRLVPEAEKVAAL